MQCNAVLYSAMHALQLGAHTPDRRIWLMADFRRAGWPNRTKLHHSVRKVRLKSQSCLHNRDVLSKGKGSGMGKAKGITPKSSLALMGIVPPSGLDGYEAGEKIGEKIKFFESWEKMKIWLGGDGNIFSTDFLQFLQVFDRFSRVEKMTEG